MTPPDWHKEDGFEFSLLPAKTGKAAGLIIIMHGHGSNTANWEEAAKQLHEQIPDADIINLQGPLKVANTSPQGYTWMPYQGTVAKQAKHTLSMIFSHLPVVDKLNSFIDKQLKKRGLHDSNLGILGSSMGGITALQTALNRDKPIGAVVSHSGALLPFTKVKSKPDILLIMGGKDDVFCKPKPGKLKRIFNKVAGGIFCVQHTETQRRLRKRHISFSEKFYPELKHESTPESIEEAGKFINNALHRKPKLKR